MTRRLSQIIRMGFIALFFSQLVSSCDFFARWKTFHEGSYNGMPYVVQEREIKGFSTNRLEHRFQLGNLPAVELTALTTDWGRPYSNDIFGTASYCYTAQNIPPYRSEDDDATNYQPFKHEFTLLYLSPRTFSKADYEQYCAFMKSEWPKIDREYAEKEYSNFPHLIGLVYARKDAITKIYKGSYKPYPDVTPSDVHRAYIRIQNDGRVELVDEDESGNIRYCGLSNRVQMPGKQLFLDTNPKHGGLGSLSAVRTFKDAQGRSPDMDFQIVERHQP